MFMLMPAEGCR